MYDEWCFDERLLMVRPSSTPPTSVYVGDAAERVPFGVGDRRIECPPCTGEPRSMPDIAEGGRYSEPAVELLPSTQGESGRAGERRDRVIDFDLSSCSVWSLTLIVLPLRLWPATLPFLPGDFCGVPFELAGTFQVTLDGVVGRDGGEVMGWYAGPERGEMGRRRPRIGDSAVSEVGDDCLFPFL